MEHRISWLDVSLLSVLFVTVHVAVEIYISRAYRIVTPDSGPISCVITLKFSNRN